MKRFAFAVVLVIVVASCVSFKKTESCFLCPNTIDGHKYSAHNFVDEHVGYLCKRCAVQHYGYTDTE